MGIVSLVLGAVLWTMTSRAAPVASDDWTQLGQCVGEHALAGQFELTVQASVLTPEKGRVQIQAGAAQYAEEGRLQIDVTKGSWKLNSLTTQAQGSLDAPVHTEISVAGRSIPVLCRVTVASQ